MENNIAYPPFFTVEDIIKQMKISRSTAYKLVNSENFPKVHIGKRIIIPTEKLLIWLEEQQGKECL